MNSFYTITYDVNRTSEVKQTNFITTIQTIFALHLTYITHVFVFLLQKTIPEMVLRWYALVTTISLEEESRQLLQSRKTDIHKLKVNAIRKRYEINEFISETVKQIVTVLNAPQSYFSRHISK